MIGIIVLNVLFGIALFLFGMHLMSEHLKKIAGSKAELFLYKLTNAPIKAVIIGTMITSIIQSSSAVSAMTVGLCESKIIKIKQAAPVILGSILGTSVTGWVVAYSTAEFTQSIAKVFSVSVLSAFFAIIGIVLKLFIKKQNIKRAGEIMLGFSILMLGINLITQAINPLKENEAFISLISSFNHPLLLFIIGIFIAALLQSASASVGIVQTLSLSSFITVHIAVPLLFGIGIGASVPVLLSAAGRNTDAKRCAFIYLFINTSCACIFGVIMLFINILGLNIYDSILLNPISVSLINTVYRFLIVLIWLPFSEGLVRISRGFIKQKKRTSLKRNMDSYSS